MLIYCSFPIMGYDSKPDWVDSLKNSLFAKEMKWSFYDPYISVREQPELLQNIQQFKINKIAEENTNLLKLNTMMLNSTPEAIQQLIRCDDMELSTDVLFKDLFMLIRANVMVVDLNRKTSGGTAQEVLYAHLLNIPVVGISFKFQVSPWMHQRCRSIINPRSPDDIHKAVLAAIM
jgi:hypothetical protein